MLVLGVDPSYTGCYWVAYKGRPLKTGDYGSIKGDLSRQSTHWKDIFTAMMYQDPQLAIEDQWMGENFRSVQKLILARGVCEGLYRSIYCRDPIVVAPRTWQSAIGTPNYSRREACEAYAKGFAEQAAGITLPNQHVREAFCIAVTTYDKLKVGKI